MSEEDFEEKPKRQVYTKATFVQQSVSKVNSKIYKKLYEAMKEVAEDYKQFFIDKFKEDKTGREYYNVKFKKRIRASAPGEYPRQATPDGEDGFLDKLLITRGNYNEGNKFVRITIFSGATYTKKLEATRKLFNEAKDEFWLLAKKRLRDNLTAMGLKPLR